MKKFLILLICSMGIPHVAPAQDFAGVANMKKEKLNDATFNGPTNLDQVEAKSLIVQGPLKFNKLKVEGDTKITGPVLESKKGEFGSLKVTGPFDGKDITCVKFKAKGPVEVTNLTVSENADIIGPFEVKKGELQDLKVKGSVEAVNLTVKGNTDITGSLDAKKSEFQNLEIKADEISLDDVRVNDIIVKGSKANEQVLQLKGKTVVNGNITFESGKGIVEQGAAVKIQGEIKGGTVNKK